MKPLRALARTDEPAIIDRVTPLYLDAYLTLRALSTYGGISVRQLRDHINDEPAHALPHYRLDGKILVKRSDFDTWMQAKRIVGKPSLVAAIKALGLATPIGGR